MSAAKKDVAEPAKPLAADLVAASRQAFGEHPEDVISPIKSAADALGWLEEIFITIEREAFDGRNGYRIKCLAEAGAYLALDVRNSVGYQHETMIDRLKTVGIIGSEVTQ